MQDKELYQHLLGLTAPWTVSEVKLDMQSQEIHVRVEHPRGTKFCCPECQKPLSCYDHGDERQWRHLDSWSGEKVSGTVSMDQRQRCRRSNPATHL